MSQILEYKQHIFVDPKYVVELRQREKFILYRKFFEMLKDFRLLRKRSYVREEITMVTYPQEGIILRGRNLRE